MSSEYDTARTEFLAARPRYEDVAEWTVKALDEGLRRAGIPAHHGQESRRVSDPRRVLSRSTLLHPHIVAARPRTRCAPCHTRCSSSLYLHYTVVYYDPICAHLDTVTDLVV